MLNAAYAVQVKWGETIVQSLDCKHINNRAVSVKKLTYE